MIRSGARVFNRKSRSPTQRLTWSGLLDTAGTITLLCTAAAFAAPIGWLFELTSHFRLQYALCLTAFTIGYAFNKRLRFASLCFAATLLNLIPLTPYLLPAHHPRPNTFPALQLLLINVHSSNSDESRTLRLIEETQPDIVLLLEFTIDWRHRLTSLHTIYPHALVEARADSFGIALFSKLPLENAQIIYCGDADVPSIEATLQFSETSVYFLGSHPVPPASPENFRFRNGQLLSLAQRLAAQPGPKVLLGDLNTSPYSPYFRHLLETSQMRDTGRGFFPKGTWPAHFLPLRIPLDHCLASPDLLVLDRRIGPHVGSDHLPLAVTLQLARLLPPSPQKN